MSARAQDDDFGKGNAAFAQRLHRRQRLATQTAIIVVRAEGRELACVWAARLDRSFGQAQGVYHIDDGARRTEVVVAAHADRAVEIEAVAFVETLRLVLEQIESPVAFQLRQQARDPGGVEVLPFVDDHEVVQGLEVLCVAAVVLDDAAAAGQRALYACFNRTLADHIGRIAPARARVSSSHEFCVEHWRRTQGEPDFTAEGIFQAVVDRYGRDAQDFEALYDLVIIDEGQDFDPAWVASLLPQLKEDGRLYLLEDEAQRLYERDGFDLDGAVGVRCNDNFRSPRAIVDVINALGLAEGTVEARSPYAGELPTFRAYDDDRGLRRQTLAAVESLRERGISFAEIVVLSARGHGRSHLLKEAKLGAFALRKFLGRYTADGEPVWPEGELLIESVHRFKGQSAMGVVLAEVDFERLDVGTCRRLFVGMTRAQLGLEVVVSRRTEVQLGAFL